MFRFPHLIRRMCLYQPSPAKKPLSVVEQALAKARKAAKKAVRKSTTDTDEEAQKQTEEIDIDLSDDDDDDLGERYASVMEAERKRVLAGGVPDPLLAVEGELPFLPPPPSSLTESSCLSNLRGTPGSDNTMPIL